MAKKCTKLFHIKANLNEYIQILVVVDILFWQEGLTYLIILSLNKLVNYVYKKATAIAITWLFWVHDRHHFILLVLVINIDDFYLKKCHRILFKKLYENNFSLILITKCIFPLSLTAEEDVNVTFVKWFLTLNLPLLKNYY